MKTLACLAASAMLTLTLDASAMTFRFDDTATVNAPDLWHYSQGGVQATVASTGANINYSGTFDAIGVDGWFSALNMTESLSITFDQPVTVSRLYFKSWQDPLFFNTVVVDQVEFQGGGTSLTLTDSGQGLLPFLDFGALASFDLPNIELNSFSLTPNSLFSGVYLWGVELETAEVPLPASAWLFGSALIGLIAARRRGRVPPSR